MKSVRTLLFILLWLPASAQHYFVVPLNPNNAEQKALNISKRFYQLSRPVKGDDVTEFLFGYIKHPVNDSIAIQIDSTTVIPKGNLSSQHITDWITETYGSLTSQQRTTLETYINSNSLLRVSRLIITTRIKLWTKAEMEARGWFNYPSMINQ